MFDKNYLGHNFEFYRALPYAINKQEHDKQCSICKIIIWYYGVDGTYNIIIDDELAGSCDISCNEYIIKNIIE